MTKEELKQLSEETFEKHIDFNNELIDALVIYENEAIAVGDFRPNNGKEGVYIRPAGIDLSSVIPFLDFHYNYSQSDYSMRLSCTGPNVLQVTSGSGNAYFSCPYFIGTVQTSSDITIKENVTPVESALDKLSSLEAIHYKYIDKYDDGRSHIGLSAQQVKEVFPDIVMEHEGKLTLAYHELIPVLIKAVNELREKDQTNENLKNEISELRKEIENLKSQR